MPPMPGTEPRPAPKRWEQRTRPPDETLAALTPLYDEMGISRIADLTDLDRIGIPVAQAVRPYGLSLSVAQGKGTSLAAAMASAAMEAAEGWHAECVDLTRRVASLREAMPGVDPGDLPVRGCLDPDVQLSFVAGVNLLDGALAWLPSDLVHKDFTRPPEHPAFRRSTNGLASGNTRAEAIAAALHEVVERDATAAFEASGEAARRVSRVSVASVADRSRVLAELIGRIRSAGLHLWLYDMTHALGVPAYRADIAEVSSSGDGGAPVRRVHAGRGCSLCPVTAATRAITEAAQSRLTEIAGSRDDLAADAYAPPVTGNLFRGLAEIASALELRPRPFDRVDESGPCAEEDVARLCARLSDHGYSRVLCADLSRPGWPIHVVRVIVPGLGFLDGHLPRLAGSNRTAAHAE
ncbi:YcaO-like family protein [Histidinibacterium aquaticum]|nr:YcaO-like family protein [Histidinibacterium aquaticum]